MRLDHYWIRTDKSGFGFAFDTGKLRSWGYSRFRPNQRWGDYQFLNLGSLFITWKRRPD